MVLYQTRLQSQPFRKHFKQIIQQFKNPLINRGSDLVICVKIHAGKLIRQKSHLTSAAMLSSLSAYIKS
jgi:hypothetical protein